MYATAVMSAFQCEQWPQLHCAVVDLSDGDLVSLWQGLMLKHAVCASLNTNNA